MKLQFFLDRVKRDLKLVPQRFVESEGADMVKLEDVEKVLKRWESALETEATLTLEAERFEEIIKKDGPLTKSEHAEAFRLLMLMHMPLIDGANDVMAVRLRDADYFRLNNKLIGRDPEEGLAAHDETYKAMMAERKAATNKKKKQAEARAKAKQEAEQARLDRSVKRYFDDKE